MLSRGESTGHGYCRLVCLQVGLHSRNNCTLGETHGSEFKPDPCSCCQQKGSRRGRVRNLEHIPSRKHRVRRIAFPLSHSQAINVSISPSCHNSYDSESLNRALRGIHRKLVSPKDQWTAMGLLVSSVQADFGFLQSAHGKHIRDTQAAAQDKLSQRPANSEQGLAVAFLPNTFSVSV